MMLSVWLFKHLSAHSILFSINQSAYKEILFNLFSAEQKAAHNCKVSFHSSATTSVACLDTDQNDSFKCLNIYFWWNTGIIQRGNISKMGLENQGKLETTSSAENKHGVISFCSFIRRKAEAKWSSWDHTEVTLNSADHFILPSATELTSPDLQCLLFQRTKQGRSNSLIFKIFLSLPFYLVSLYSCNTTCRQML